MVEVVLSSLRMSPSGPSLLAPRPTPYWSTAVVGGVVGVGVVGGGLRRVVVLGVVLVVVALVVVVVVLVDVVGRMSEITAPIYKGSVIFDTLEPLDFATFFQFKVLMQNLVVYSIFF